jgi:hypothetical protein
VVVVFIPELVVRLSVSQVNTVDKPVPLHARYCSKDTGVVGAAKRNPDRLMEFVE